MAMCMVFGSASFMVLVFAGLATVLLLLRSRSATLRQINANLLQISEQLKSVPPELRHVSVVHHTAQQKSPGDSPGAFAESNMIRRPLASSSRA